MGKFRPRQQRRKPIQGKPCIFWEGQFKVTEKERQTKLLLISLLHVCANVKAHGRRIKTVWVLKNKEEGASLVAQWLKICPPMQGTRVWALVREDPTCRGATKPVHHNYWACALELMSHNYWAHVPQLLKPTRLEPMLHNKRSYRNEKPMHHNYWAHMLQLQIGRASCRERV